MQQTKPKNNSKGRYMKIVVAFIIAQAVIYTWIHMFLSYKVGLEIAPTTSVGFYSFCGLEAGVCGWLKITKDKNTTTTNEGKEGDEVSG